MALFIFLVILAYLMGSICSAIIVCRTFALPDPRTEGSKNPGATNVLRIAGKQYAAIVMVFDLLKGTIPVLIAKMFDADPTTLAFTALAAVLGHMYPIFFNFKGGKGVATAIGALLGFHFLLGVSVAATWLLVANFSHYSSLASIISMSLAPLYSLMMIGQVKTFPPLICITILILFKHKTNINRLIDGVEPKFKFKHSVIEEVLESSPQPVSAHEVPESIAQTPKKEHKARAPVQQRKSTKKTTEATEESKKTTAAKPRAKKATTTKKTVKKAPKSEL